MQSRQSRVGLVAVIAFGLLTVTSYLQRRVQPTGPPESPADCVLDEYLYCWIHTETDQIEWTMVCGDQVFVGFSDWSSESRDVLKEVGRAASRQVRHPIWLWAVPAELREAPPQLGTHFWWDPQFPYYTDLVVHGGTVRGEMSDGAAPYIWEEWSASKNPIPHRTTCHIPSRNPPANPTGRHPDSRDGKEL